MIAAATCVTSPANADLSYVLQPGSTITPWYNGQASGPSQPLRGTFAWNLFWVDPKYMAFDATSLDFQSFSFHLTLDTTAANDLASSCNRFSQSTAFGEVVNSSGLPGVPLQMAPTVDGSYEGSCESPTRLTYPGLFVTAPGGHIAFMSFTAVQVVPEPTALVLLMGGLVLLARRKLAAAPR